ncbi:MAG: aminotransferase class V-fold PLP-dependent enzyme [Nitrospinota bacterium]
MTAAARRARAKRKGSRAQAIEWRRGICGICPAGCWVEAGLRGGRLVDIRADATHPLGMLCRRGQHAPEIAYSRHRLRHPMRRVGPKGAFRFERISWDEAYGEIVNRLLRIREESGPEAAAIYTGRGSFELSLCDMFQPKGAAVSSASNVLFRYGSPNTMGVGALCYVSFAMIAPHVTMGRMLINMFSEIEHAGMVVVWGANPATDSPPLDMHRLLAAAQRGAEIVVIDPRRSETAARTGARWIPIRPGTDGALALSLIQVMIEEEIHDEGFALNWTHGFPELRSYVQHFRPEAAEAVTGVPAETIRWLARRMCAAAGCAPVMYTGLEYSDSGVQAIRAVLAAWALAGQLDVPGGLVLAMRGSHFPINRSSNVANPDPALAAGRRRFPVYTRYRRECHASALVDAVRKGDPYPIRALIVQGASLLTSWPETSLWRETLARLDFLVTIDRQLTADAAYADIVLPATTMFEIGSYMVYGPIFRLRERLIEPVGEARNDYLIMAELARRLGYGEQYPQSEEALLRFALEGSGFTLEQVREAGGMVRIPAPMLEYQKWRKGSLRADGRPGFDTPTGKFEIHSTLLEEHGHEPLPKYTEPAEGPIGNPALAKEFPLVFNSGARLQTDFRSQHHGIPGLVRENPEPVAELHPEDAAPRGVRTGDLVEVRTPRGAVRFRARVTEDIVRGAVECNFGGGTPVGPKAWRGSNVNELTSLARCDEISGFPVFKALLCEVAKVRGKAARPPRNGRPSPSREAPQVKAAEAPARRIYLDNNATTRVDDAVREAMLPYLGEGCGNPSSLHGAGRRAREAVSAARRQVAALLGTNPRRIVFTGSGSESNNLALKGAAFARRERGNHIVTTRIEHPSVLGACRFLERTGFEVTYLDVDREGWLDPARLRGAVREGTILVSVMMANNEVGTILPIRGLCDAARAGGALFHTDAVQAVGKIPVDAEALGVDLLSLAAHKFHGPKGAGALYVRKGVEIEPLIHGGQQEGGVRAGTENVPQLVGMGKAAELALGRLAGAAEVRRLRDRLEAGVRRLVPGARLNGHPESRLPNTLNMTLPGLRGESLVIALDQHGVALSSGSACKSGSPEPTHVLLAMGRSEEEAHCAVRLSLSRATSEADVDEALAALARVLEEMETAVRFLPCK